MTDEACKPPADMERCTATFKGWYKKRCTGETGWHYTKKGDFSGTKGLRCPKFEDLDDVSAQNPEECRRDIGPGEARYFQFYPGQSGISCKRVTVANCNGWKRVTGNKVKKLGADQNGQQNIDFDMIGFLALP